MLLPEDGNHRVYFKFTKGEGLKEIPVLGSPSLPNPFFNAYDDVRELCNIFKKCAEDASHEGRGCIVLTGEEGVGKSAVAKFVYYRLRNFYGFHDHGVIWKRFDPMEGKTYTHSNFINDLLVLVKRTVQSGNQHGKMTDLMDELRHSINTKKMLLFLDDIDKVITDGDPDKNPILKVIQKLQNGCRNLNILITSRFKLYISGQHLSIQGLSQKKGAETLFKTMLDLNWVKRLKQSRALPEQNEKKMKKAWKIVKKIEGIKIPGYCKELANQLRGCSLDDLNKLDEQLGDDGSESRKNYKKVIELIAEHRRK